MNDVRKRTSTACGLASVLLAIAALAGCAREGSVATSDHSQDRVEVQLVDRVALNAVLANLKGRVVLVDCWATWCLPCMELLPHSVELAKQHADDDFTVVTLDFDDPDSQAAVVAALEKVGANGPGILNFQATRGASTISMNEFVITGGALPHFKLYDRQGEVRRIFTIDPSAAKQFTPADIDAAIQELLAE